VANFGEPRTGEVCRISLLGTWVNKGMKRKGRGCSRPRPSHLALELFVSRLFRLMRDNLTLCDLGWVW
jgi:hypothetical protein